MTGQGDDEREPVTGQRMPVLFIGHGSPMNAIEDNEFSSVWMRLRDDLPTPKAILSISAHWESKGTLVTAMEDPRTIHDFWGFPRELYSVLYAAPGSRILADRVISILGEDRVGRDMDWGLDHGAWSVLRRIYPEARIPVVQLSLDRNASPEEHVHIARGLAALRNEGILVLGSGNIVHNLRMARLNDEDINRHFGYDWATKANDLLKDLIMNGEIERLADYGSLGDAVRLAVPTNEHYLPMLYALALREENDGIEFFNDALIAGSLSMTSFRIG